ncbi:MAG: DAK2 domain-containing protein [Dehalococcoidia bacterium]|nr:DAK2 domain-containing protein [Dehalococcoidia bacterium]
MTTSTVESLSGTRLHEMFAAATAWLERHIDQINAVNVFPVPDGDTGANMYLTMRSTMEEAGRCADDAVGPMLAAMSHGALMGARGNSGVILSQIIRGMAQAVAGSAAMDCAALARGLEEGSAAAYRAVTKPAEGTILTVVREVSQAARSELESGRQDLVRLMETAVREARESVARTPTLLPVLAEAGVVDAGALGLATLLEGMLRYLKGEPVDEATDLAAESVGQDWLSIVEQRHETQESLYGYCTEVLVAGSGLDVDALRGRVLELGDSVLVVGDDQMVRVHVHTDDPGAVLSTGTAVGSLAQVKVDNIRRQAESFVQMHEERLGGPAEAPAICTVAVAAGEGLAGVFAGVGCTKVVSGGPTMNPSTRDILEAVEACPSGDVVVLPNDKNIIMAARLACDLTRKRMRVVPSRSVPQGIAALLAMSPEEGLEENIKAMEQALASVRTIEVTRAVRSTKLKGVRIKEGDVIAIVDDELKLAAESPEAAVQQALGDIAGGETSLITLYYGAGTQRKQADALAAQLRRRFRGHEVEVIFGGQPHYDYIVSLE